MGQRVFTARTAGLAAALLLAAAPLWAGRVLPATDAALVPGEETTPGVAESPAASEVPGLDPTVLRAEIDLLLDVQVETPELGATPADGPAVTELSGAVDPWVLSPGLPANPRFPGVGLPFSLPAVAGRVSLGDAERDDPSAAPGRWSSSGGGWLGRDADGRLAEPVTELRAWVAANRTPLLAGLGVAALVIAAFTALTRPSGGSASQRRRRRRRSGASDFGQSSAFASTSGPSRVPDDPSTLPATAGDGERRPRRRRRRRSSGVDPATHGR